MEERSVATQSMSSPAPISLFDFGSNFGKACSFAETLSKSKIIPDTFQGNPASCLIALDMANRMRRNPLEVMQAMYVVHGKPSFSSSFLISLINSCGFYEPLRFRFEGEGEGRSCMAWTVDRRTGETVEGPVVSIKMAREEGWFAKPGSKWKTMPEVMLRYRAASFFSRAYCPDLTGGFHSSEEVQDTESLTVATAPTKNIEAQLLGESQAQLPPAAVSGNDEGKRRKAIWDKYLELCGDRERAIATISAITEGRGSKDWTTEDMSELEKQITIIATPTQALELDSPEDLAAEMGIGEDSKASASKPMTELEKLRLDLDALLGAEGLDLTEPERAEWVARHFGESNLNKLKKDKLHEAIQLAQEEIRARDAAVFGG